MLDASTIRLIAIIAAVTVAAVILAFVGALVAVILRRHREDGRVIVGIVGFVGDPDDGELPPSTDAP